jgi:hypothetical protein
MGKKGPFPLDIDIPEQYNCMLPEPIHFSILKQLSIGAVAQRDNCGRDGLL